MLSYSVYSPHPTQLVQVKPGPSYVAELSREIERVDTHLSHFKGWQASSSAVLVEQECQLQVCVCVFLCSVILSFCGVCVIQGQAAASKEQAQSFQLGSS